ncbi:DUF4153 domain-containing protein [Actinokineospora sp. G85]|uniref:DUF4153 domain-containing protein n=1 Tax=Actinokineospora sp. G85 TaxID=3406626 RepID=UPI003C765C51
MDKPPIQTEPAEAVRSSRPVHPGRVPTQPGWVERHWRPRSPRASRPVVLWAVGAALLGAWALPLDVPGAGWTVAALGVATALLALGRTARANWWWLLLGVALMTLPTLRAASWLTALAVLGAGVALAASVSRGRTARDLVWAPVLYGAAVFRALPWAGRGLKHAGGGQGGVRVARTVALSLLVLLVFGGLLAGADSDFADLLDLVLPAVDGESLVLSAWVFAVLLALVLAGSFLLDSPADAPEPGRPRRTVRVAEWAWPVGVLVALFAAFVATQVRSLFGGEGHVLRTASLTYAEYARSGFWQLLVVTALTLAVIGLVARVAPRETAEERLWLRSVLGVLVVLALVIVASALVRIWVYQGAYGYTLLRLLVSVAELWMAVLFVLVLVAGARRRAPWLPSAVVGSALVALFALGLLDPERFVAERNVARFAETGRLDVDHLSTLMADAVPALTALPEPQRSCLLSHQLAELEADERLTEWNLGRERARRALAEVGVDRRHDCYSAR